MIAQIAQVAYFLERFMKKFDFSRLLDLFGDVILANLEKIGIVRFAEFVVYTLPGEELYIFKRLKF